MCSILHVDNILATVKHAFYTHGHDIMIKYKKIKSDDPNVFKVCYKFT